MRIAIISDTSPSQINGVVNTLQATIQCLRQKQDDVLLLDASLCKTIPCPTYPEIRLAWRPYAKVSRALKAFKPDYIHIATEGPMGMAARRYCLRHQLQFTTAYHTRFPEYLHARFKLAPAVTYRFLRWFHGRSKAVLVPTQQIMHTLHQQGLGHAVLWGRGVDTALFTPGAKQSPYPISPVFLYVGRVAIEKNIEAFLQLKLPGLKVVVGDGPMRKTLQEQYPDVLFAGAHDHHALPACYRRADVFVFPSRTDTFGLVLAEAMACGIPVAAFPVPGPMDVVAHGISGILDEDLEHACLEALKLPGTQARQHALRYSWDNATQQFRYHLHHIHDSQPATLAVSMLQTNFPE